MCGKPDNPPLVMIHGLGVNSTSFHNNIEQLNKKFRIYLLDFPGGSGRSVPSQLMLKQRNVAGWLTDTISQIEDRKVTVLGASFGSWVAVEYALTKPKQLAKLILTAPPPLAGKAKLKISTLMKMIFLGLNKNKANMEKLCKLLSAPNYTPDNRTVTAIYNGLKYTKSFKESDHTIKKPLANDIVTPIHFIMGEHDMLCDPASLPNHFPKAHITIIDNAGHLVGIEKSDHFNQIIIESMKA
jgi:pimeloyl-ACP methyl ester carboxylesterase